MPVSKKQAMEMFDHDLGFFMNDIRGLLAHYRIGDWEAYLFFRKPDCPQSYVLKYEAVAGDEFAQKIVALHAAPAAPPLVRLLGDDVLTKDDPRYTGTLCDRRAERYRVDLMLPDELWTVIHDGFTHLCGKCIAELIENRGEHGWLDVVKTDAALRTSVEGTEENVSANAGSQS